MARFKITDGPSKFDLMVALFHKAISNPTTVQFTFHEEVIFSGSPTPFTWNIIIDSVGREDGSGESWLFTGSYRDVVAGMTRNLRGFFSTRNRRGWAEEV